MEENNEFEDTNEKEKRAKTLTQSISENYDEEVKQLKGKLHLEAERIFRVVENVFRKVEILSIIVYFKDNYTEACVDLPDYVITAVEDYTKFCNLSFNKNHDEISKMIVPASETFEVPLDCKGLMKKWISEPWELSDDIISHVTGHLKDMSRAIRTYMWVVLQILLQSPVDMIKEQKQLKELTAKRSGHALVIEQLQQQLSKLIQQRDKSISERHQKYSVLNEEVTRIEWLAADTIDSTIKYATSQQEENVNTCEDHVSQLAEEAEITSQQLALLLQDHMEYELRLREKRIKMEEDVLRWIKKYDAEMGDRQDEYDALEKEYLEEKKEAKDLQDQVDALTSQYNIIMEEKRKLQEERERLQAEMEKHILAATVIQAHWRGFLTRKVLQGKAKGKGKAKKSKKGKKKKK